jgi:HD-like signal output (HDOD) protein
MALQHEMRKEEANLKKVAQLIGRDAAMAGTLLETANSAFFALRRPVETVQDAIALIGMNQCSAMMTLLITRKVLNAGGMMMARFWDVSEKRALGMSYLARETRAARPDLAHSFGLFCDIGIPLLKAKVPTYLETLSLANRAAARRFIEVEHARHGINHALVGALLAEKWAISSDIVQAIRKHHDSDVLFDESVPVTVRNLVALNHVVEKAIQTHRGEAESLEWLEDGSAAIEALGWSQSDVDDTCEALVDRFKRPNSALRASSM